MLELLAVPEWNATPRPLADWVSALAARGHAVATERESSGYCWIEVAGLRLRGYAEIENGMVTAIDFELHDPDPGPARRTVEDVARSLGWEVHEEDGPEDEDD